MEASVGESGNCWNSLQGQRCLCKQFLHCPTLLVLLALPCTLPQSHGTKPGGWMLPGLAASWIHPSKASGQAGSAGHSPKALPKLVVEWSLHRGHPLNACLWWPELLVVLGSMGWSHHKNSSWKTTTPRAPYKQQIETYPQCSCDHSLKTGKDSCFIWYIEIQSQAKWWNTGIRSKWKNKRKPWKVKP